MRTIVGWITRLGYLYCDGCHGDVPGDIPVYAGSQPHAAEKCERCGHTVDPDLHDEP